MNRIFLSATIALTLFFSACKSQKEVRQLQTELQAARDEIRRLETSAELDEYPLISEEIIAPEASGEPYQPVRTRYNDILHTDLDLQFDWAKRQVKGKAYIEAQPYFYPQASLELDAQGFDVHAVGKVNSAGAIEPLTYTYKQNKLSIALGKTYLAGEKYKIYIEYTAKPYEREAGGGSAVTSDRGLFFINHDQSDPFQPQQIWSQGETHFNSCWFPCFDDPSEKMTQQIALTVENRFLTISNGAKISAKDNGNGTRTDIWKQDKPHSPYLTAIVIGEFAEYKDTWRGKEVNYYVKKEYGPYAKSIFGNTPEMLSFFSQKMGVEFPWEKYSQVVVEEFVSGAMENTSCVTFFDRMLTDDRQLLDDDNEHIIAHELFHHWFGDLVTCESFGNLTLNEGFASYSEYLWMEHKYGKDKADEHLLDDLTNYLISTNFQGVKPIIRTHYRHADDMFDVNSYQKGALVLHTLRNYVGDSAFFLTLKNYLNRYAYQHVELANLRMEFEKTTGEDLNWFFNQWFLSVGHPRLEYSYRTQPGQQVWVTVKQTQDPNWPTFKLPTYLQLNDIDGKITRIPVTMTNRDTTFRIPYTGNLATLMLDPDKAICGVVTKSITKNEAINQLRYGQNYRQKSDALQALSSKINEPGVLEVFLEKLKDPFAGIRSEAIFSLVDYSGSKDKEVYEAIFALAGDESAKVREAALFVLTSPNMKNIAEKQGSLDKVLALTRKACNDKSYMVQSTALNSLVISHPNEAVDSALQMLASPYPKEWDLALNTLSSSEDSRISPAMVSLLNANIDSERILNIMGTVADYFTTEDDPKQIAANYEALMNIAANAKASSTRILAIEYLQQAKDKHKPIVAFLAERKKVEKSPAVLQILD